MKDWPVFNDLSGVIAPEFEATVDIGTLEIMEGELPGRALNLVREWAMMHNCWGTGAFAERKRRWRISSHCPEWRLFNVLGRRRSYSGTGLLPVCTL
jgi:hypothetical protein